MIVQQAVVLKAPIDIARAAPQIVVKRVSA